MSWLCVFLFLCFCFSFCFNLLLCPCVSFSLLSLPVPHLIVSVSVFIVLVVHKVLVSLFRQPLSSPVFLHLHSVLFHLPPLLPVFPALFWFSLYLVVAFLYFFIFLNFLLPAPLVLPWYASGFCSSCLVIDLCLSFHCYFVFLSLWLAFVLPLVSPILPPMCVCIWVPI